MPEEQEIARPIPSSLLVNCGDAWAESSPAPGVGSAASTGHQRGDDPEGTWSPAAQTREQRHLVSDKARADLAEIISPELGGPVHIDVTLGSIPRGRRCCSR